MPLKSSVGIEIKALLIVRGAFQCRNAVTLWQQGMHLRVNWKFWIVSWPNIFTKCHHISRSWLTNIYLKTFSAFFISSSWYEKYLNFLSIFLSLDCKTLLLDKGFSSYEKLLGWNSAIQAVRSDGIYIYVNWTDKKYFQERKLFSQNLQILITLEQKKIFRISCCSVWECWSLHHFIWWSTDESEFMKNLIKTANGREKIWHNVPLPMIGTKYESRCLNSTSQFKI